MTSATVISLMSEQTQSSSSTSTKRKRGTEDIPSCIDIPALQCSNAKICAAFQKYKRTRNEVSSKSGKINSNPCYETNDDSDDIVPLTGFRRDHCLTLRKKLSQNSLQSYAFKSANSFTGEDSLIDCRAPQENIDQSSLSCGHNASFDLSTYTHRSAGTNESAVKVARKILRRSPRHYSSSSEISLSSQNSNSDIQFGLREGIAEKVEHTTHSGFTKVVTLGPSCTSSHELNGRICISPFNSSDNLCGSDNESSRLTFRSRNGHLLRQQKFMKYGSIQLPSGFKEVASMRPKLSSLSMFSNMDLSSFANPVPLFTRPISISDPNASDTDRSTVNDVSITRSKPPVVTKSPVTLYTDILTRDGYEVVFRPSLHVEGYFVHPALEDIEAYDEKIKTAIVTSNFTLLRKMCKDGISLQSCNSVGEGPTHLTCRLGLLDVTKFLIKEVGVSVRVVDDAGRTPLHEACAHCKVCLDLAEILITVAPDLLLMCDEKGYTPLQYIQEDDWSIWTEFLMLKLNILKPQHFTSKRLVSARN